MGHLLKDCHACFDIIGERNTVPHKKLLYGDWMRVSLAPTRKQLQGSLAHRNSSINVAALAVPSRGTFSSTRILGKEPLSMDKILGSGNCSRQLENVLSEKETAAMSQQAVTTKKGKETMDSVTSDSFKSGTYIIPHHRPKLPSTTQLPSHGSLHLSPPSTISDCLMTEVDQPFSQAHLPPILPNPRPKPSQLQATKTMRSDQCVTQPKQTKKIRPKPPSPPISNNQLVILNQPISAEPKKRGRPPNNPKPASTSLNPIQVNSEVNDMEPVFMKKHCPEVGNTSTLPEAVVAEQPRLSQ